MTDYTDKAYSAFYDYSKWQEEDGRSVRVLTTGYGFVVIERYEPRGHSGRTLFEFIYDGKKHTRIYRKVCSKRQTVALARRFMGDIVERVDRVKADRIKKLLDDRTTKGEVLHWQVARLSSPQSPLPQGWRNSNE